MIEYKTSKIECILAGSDAEKMLIKILDEHEKSGGIPYTFEGPEVAGVFVDRGGTIVAFDNRNLEILAHFDVGAILREENHSPYDARVFLSYYDIGLTDYHVSQYWAELGRAVSNWHGRDFIQTVSSSVFIEFWRF